MTEQDIRETLHAERKRQNKSRLWIARKAGVCENTVYNFEKNPGYNSTFYTAVHIADALGYRIVWTLEKKANK